MLKFGGSRPESDGNEVKDRERKQRHQRSGAPAAAAAAVGGATASTLPGGPVPGNGTSGMDSNRAGLGSEATPKPLHQMAPPDIPFGSGQPPVVRILSF